MAGYKSDSFAKTKVSQQMRTY